MHRNGWRILRTYTRIAHTDHRCSECPLPIFPGDEYIGEIMVWRKPGKGSSFYVRKQHRQCPWDPELDRKHREWLDSLYSEEIDKEEPIAA